MEREAFRQRMQQYKQARENNPQLKYWDWKKYADGGTIDEDKVGNPSVQSIQQRQWLNNWLKNRTKQMAENIDFYSNQNYYGSAVDRFHVAPFFWQNKEKNAAKIIEEQLEYANSTPIYDYREPWIAADKSIPYRNKFLKQKLGVQGEFRSGYKQPRAISISPIAQDQSVILHELTHASQDLYKIQESVVNDILDKNNEKKDKYLDNPAEVYARLMQFRYDNNLNPTDTITKQQIEEWQKDKYIQDKEFINRYSSSTLEDLLNSVAMNYANGGIIDEDPPQNTSERPITNFDPKGDPYNPTYGYNPGAGYVSNSDPLGSLYIEGALLNPVFKLAGNVVSNVARGLTKYSSKYVPEVKRTVQDKINNLFRREAEDKARTFKLYDDAIESGKGNFQID